MPHDEIQRIQSNYRRRLAQTWPLAPGMKILEVGCGQGDMTAILAESVGPTGHITATDIASPDYGAPLTLQQATDLIKATPLGERIDFLFECDLLDPSTSFAENAFDAAILAHCSWYFASVQQLRRTFQALKPWAKHLYFAEWNLNPVQVEQSAHFLAVLIQGQVEAFKASSQANIRNPIPKQPLKRLLEESGWTITQEATPDTSDLQDADWEIQMCLRESAQELETLAIPERAKQMILTQLEILREISQPKGNMPLPAYSLTAERS